jgi:hypothetical protein
MKEILSYIFTALEALNNRIGPILQLNGWSNYMKNNMSRFDRVLERFYHRYWRHGQPSPFMEFGGIVFGSMIMWHLQNKYLGGINVTEMVNNFSRGGGGNNSSGGDSRGGGGGGNNSSGGGGSGNNSGGGGFMSGGLGNILRLFTGGGGGDGRSGGVGVSSGHENTTTNKLFMNNIHLPSSPLPPSTTTTTNTTTNTPPHLYKTSPNSASTPPVPPSGQVATLPSMNLKKIIKNDEQNTIRKQLRRPSAYLREPDNK